MKERRILDKRIDMERLPRHVAIIMDGNGRWAKAHGKRRAQGHEAGAQSVREVLEACGDLGIETLTLFAFSTENWRRSKSEINSLFRLMSKYIHKGIDDIHKNNVRVRFLGKMEGLPERAVKDMQYCLDLTRNNTAGEACVALNYGGRMEIVDAARRIAEEARAGKLDPAALDEATFANYLYVPDRSEVDLLIRTSGEMRISNFMLWQISYAEIVVTPVLWPDFRKPHLCDAVVEYQSRRRRFGGRP